MFNSLLSKIGTAIIIAHCLLSGTAYCDEVSVIANKNIKLDSIQLTDLQRLYLGRVTEIDNQKVQPIDFARDSETRRSYYTKILKRTPEQMERYWARAVFTGTATPPKTVASEEEMKKTVGAESAIGYIPCNPADGNIKKLAIE